MDFAGEFDARASVESLTDWWETAGVTNAVAEEPVNWLQAARPAPSSAMGAPAPTALMAATPRWPESLEPFQQWLTTDEGIPELAWPQLSGRVTRTLPTGPAAPPLMFICDMPDPQDMEQDILLSGDCGKLFDAMLSSLGLQRSQIYLSSLAISRPAGGIISENDAAQLALRMRHHIALVAPRRVVLMGDKTSRALLPMIDGENASGLRPLNHEGGTLDSIAIMHPRVLLKQPAAKMRCWRQLQLLIEALPT